ncbi:hypothetical protein [Amycolatopsis sp. NPDC051061]|uniref:hypothetical protein n=1 Tax=Amycolatopsis sp. NPDC051061 TaxID=3155042 RepID=UPI0034122988
MAAIDQDDLERRLGLGRVDQEELAFVIQNVIKSARYPSNRRINFPGDGPIILSLLFDKHGTLTGISPGEALTAELVEQIEREVVGKLLAPTRSMVHRIPLFAWFQTKGYWRHEDKLVFRPVPDRAPQPWFLMAPHPLILEVSFSGANDSSIAAMRGRRASGQMALFLSLLIPGLQIPSLSNSWSHRWVIVQTDPPSPRAPALAADHYFIEDFEPFVDSLSNKGSLPDIELVEGLPMALGIDRKFVLPDTISRHLGIFAKLSDSDSRKMLRAAYWLHHAQEVWDLSKSASYQALIQAVEVLIEVPQDQPRCTTCDRTLGVGPTKLFREFIDRFAPMADSSEDPARKRLYAIRSMVAHGNSLFYADENVDVGWHSPTPMHEYELMEGAKRICRRAVI